MHSLQAAINVDLHALVHDFDESGVVLLADNERVWLSGLACSKRRKFIGEAVHDGMVLQFDVDLHFFSPLLEVIERMQKNLHLVRRSLRKHASSDDPDHMALSSVLHGEDQSE